MDNVQATAITIVTAIIGLAMLAVIVSRRAQTPEVLGAAGSSLAQVIGAAVSPLGDGNDNATAFGSGSGNFAGGIGGIISALPKPPGFS